MAKKKKNPIHSLINCHCSTTRTKQPHSDFDLTGERCKCTMIDKKGKGIDRKFDNLAIWQMDVQ